jgi:FkbM family methyltransferase
MKDPVDLLPSNRTPLGKLLRLPLRLLPRGWVVPVLGGPNAGMKWIVGSGPASCWLGINEVSKRRLFSRIVRPGSTVFDIGAHVGSYTLQAARLCGSGGHIIAFEPAPENLAFLRRHVELNRLSNVRVIAAAMSDSDGAAGFQCTPERVTSHLAANGSITVECYRVDTLIERNDVPVPDCIKIDVEGAEAAVLRGAIGLLQTHRPIVFLATHGHEPEVECLRILESAGYRMEPIAGLEREFIATAST